MSFGWVEKVDEWKAQLLQETLKDSGGILGCLISKKSRLCKVKAATEMTENQTQSNIGHRIQWVTAGCSWIEPCLCIAAWVISVVAGCLSSKQEINQPLPTHEDFQILWPDWMPDSSPDTCTGVPLDSWAGAPIPRSAPVTWHSSQQPED